ncbi:uncharacterized protein [Elaeis guineensis]|uniref:uncharacterized protein n=1 Tax=Elaeis guineensis var. tenera TaxID=51953 RepID=UPI003C6D7C2C
MVAPIPKEETLLRMHRARELFKLLWYFNVPRTNGTVDDPRLNEDRQYDSRHFQNTSSVKRRTEAKDPATTFSVSGKLYVCHDAAWERERWRETRYALPLLPRRRRRRWEASDASHRRRPRSGPGAVGRALGLDPSTVRLNGHFLSRSPDLVSSVTWGSLLSFFASRGFPSGSSDGDAVVVQGKPAATRGLQFSDLEDENYLSFKRKVRLENECPLKKNRVTEGNSCMLEFGDRQLSDDDSLCIKRRLKLEDDNSFKKRKITECNSDSVNKQSKLETVVPKTGFSYGCINEHGKRLREEETVPTIPSKRVC